MSIYYHSTSAYKSQFRPSELFETKEEALAYDIQQANNLFIENQTAASLVEFANGICIEQISKALDFLIEARKEIASERSYKEWVAQNAKAKIIAGPDECETGVALTQAINEVLAEDAETHHAAEEAP